MVPGDAFWYERAVHSGKKGGKIKLDLGWVKIEVKIKKKALSGDMTLSLCVEEDEQGIPWFVAEGNPHQECDPPAKLKIKAKVLCPQIDPSTLVVVHQAQYTAS